MEPFVQCSTWASVRVPAAWHFNIGIASVERQICVGPACLMFAPSLVCVAGVHVSSTLSPLRVAARSSTGRGSCNDGACGAPGDAHPTSTISSPNATPCAILMEAHQGTTPTPDYCLPTTDSCFSVLHSLLHALLSLRT